jgi:hypothetical protein
MPEVLFASEVSFRGLNRRVAEQELNLLQFAAVGMAQFGAGSPQVVRRDPLQSRFLAAALHHIPNDVL